VAADWRNSSSMRRCGAGRKGDGIVVWGIVCTVVNLPSWSLTCSGGVGCDSPGVVALGVAGSRSTKLAPSLSNAGAGYNH
jgi:hypothetical protein